MVEAFMKEGLLDFLGMLLFFAIILLLYLFS